jgi:hypothetical protein
MKIEKIVLDHGSWGMHKKMLTGRIIRMQHADEQETSRQIPFDVSCLA